MPKCSSASLLGVLLAVLRRLAAALCSPFSACTKERRPATAGQSSAWQRLSVCKRAQGPVLYHAVALNLGELLCACLGTNAIAALKDSLASHLSSFAGSHETSDGRFLQRSFVNALDPDFSVPPALEAAAFPFWGEDDELGAAHLMCVAAKLAYEDGELVRNVVLCEWGFPWCIVQEKASGSLSSLSAKWFAFGNKRATGLVFASDWGPLSVASWSSFASTSYSHRSGFGGVHDRIFNALFSRPEDASISVFDQALQAIELRVLDQDQQLFIAGHGMGGAVADVFAQALGVKRPKMASKLAGVFTFGGPCAGDLAFAQQLCATFGGGAQRFVLCGDVVPLLPCAPEGAHHAGERIILSSWEWKARGKAAGLVNRPFWQIMLPSVLWRKAAAKGHFAHIFWAALPGFASHLPGEYVRALCAQLDGGVLQPRPQSFVKLHPVGAIAAEELKAETIAAWKPSALQADILSAHNSFPDTRDTQHADAYMDSDAEFEAPRGSGGGTQSMFGRLDLPQGDLPSPGSFDRLRSLHRGDSASEYYLQAPGSGASSVVPEEEFSDISLEEEVPIRRRGRRARAASRRDRSRPPSASAANHAASEINAGIGQPGLTIDAGDDSEWHDCEPYPCLRSPSAQFLELAVPDS